MDSLSFTPGQAILTSNSPVYPWAVVFEDEGPGGYAYARDRSKPTEDASIVDAMLIYNRASLAASAGELAERLASIEWSPNGLQAVLYLDGRPQALFDFEAGRGFCRMDFPNFLATRGGVWRRDTHAWSEEAFARFEAAKFQAALEP
ncbi:MAG: DUF2251 domain-containing protein [Acidobacteriota bacterium]|nr:DUF2251 domain-containing protein [Acidobacteriota bacterium]